VTLSEKLDRFRSEEFKAREGTTYRGIDPVVHKFKRLAKKGLCKADKRPCMAVTPILKGDWIEVRLKYQFVFLHYYFLQFRFLESVLNINLTTSIKDF